MNYVLRSVGLTLLVLGMASGQTQPSASIDSTQVKSPGMALLYSIIPGGGQLYNENPLKAAIFASAFAYYGYGYSLAQDEYQSQPTSESLHRSRNDKVWMMSLVWTLNILDAYVDAQLWDFEKYEIEDAQPDENSIKPKETGIIDDTE